MRVNLGFRAQILARPKNAFRAKIEFVLGPIPDRLLDRLIEDCCPHVRSGSYNNAQCGPKPDRSLSEIPGRDVPALGGDCENVQLQTGLFPNRRPEILVERHERPLVLVVSEKIVGAFAEKRDYRTGLVRRVFDHNRGAEFIDRLPHSK